MLGTSLEHRGAELLSFHGGAAAFRAGHTTGLPLLAPWANRLSRKRFRIGRVDVDVRRAPAVDPNGLPIHGTMLGAFPWTVVRAEASRLVARYEYEHPAFPFPHELEIDARLSERGLRVRTSVRATGRRRVPVSFGWHPYFRVPGPRRRWLLRLPTRRNLELDERRIPTGRATPERAEETPLGTRSFDDLYALGRDRRLGIAGGGRCVDVRFGSTYPFAQVYAPPDRNFISLEPMTAPIDALVKGACPSVAPGDRFSATFTISAV